MYAKVCFPFSLDKTFTYRVPSTIAPYLNAGTLVTVIFKNKKCDGFIISLSNTTRFKGKINFIVSINNKASIPNELWQTLTWVLHLLQHVCPHGLKHTKVFSKKHNYTIHMNRKILIYNLIL